MMRILAFATWFALGAGVVMAGSALAQTPDSWPPPSTSGSAQAQNAAYPAPATPPPAGFHYEWIFNYDRHGDYLGHWRMVRDR